MISRKAVTSYKMNVGVFLHMIVGLVLHSVAEHMMIAVVALHTMIVDAALNMVAGVALHVVIVGLNNCSCNHQSACIGLSV